jgi:HEAT repeat protein
VRYNVVRALGAIGPAAAVSVPDLIKILDAPDHADNGNEAGKFVAQIKGHTMRSRETPGGGGIIECTEDVDMRAATIDTLGLIGSGAAAAESSLLAQLRRSDSTDDRSLLAKTLLRIGASPTEPLRAMMEMARGPKPYGPALFALIRLTDLVKDRGDSVDVLQEAIRMAEAAGFQRLAGSLRHSLNAIDKGVPDPALFPMP